MNSLACPVQSQHNADERLDAAQEPTAAQLNWQHAQDRAASTVCVAIRALPQAMQTKSVYQMIVATLLAEIKHSNPTCKSAIDGLVDAFIGLDEKS